MNLKLQLISEVNSTCLDKRPTKKSIFTTTAFNINDDITWVNVTKSKTVADFDQVYLLVVLEIHKESSFTERIVISAHMALLNIHPH